MRVWTRHLGDTRNEIAYDLLIVGSSLFMYGEGKSTTMTNGADDFLLVKMDLNGNKQFVQHMGGSGLDQGRALASDGDGNLYLFGQSDSPGMSTDFFDTVLMKVSSDGAGVWGVYFGNNLKDDTASTVQAESDGSAIYTLGVLEASALSHGEKDMLVGKFQGSDGTKVWIVHTGGE